MDMTAAGIDVGKASLDLAVDGQAGVTRHANTGTGTAKLVKRMKALGASRIVVEATGGYEEPLLEACCDAGLWIARVNPRQARSFALATGELAKTDAIEHARHGVLAGEADHVRGQHLAEPFAVEPHLGALAIEHLEHLLGIGPSGLRVARSV
jgi:transposase